MNRLNGREEVIKGLNRAPNEGVQTLHCLNTANRFREQVLQVFSVRITMKGVNRELAHIECHEILHSLRHCMP